MPTYGIFDAQPDGAHVAVRFTTGDAPKEINLAEVRADLTRLIEETGAQRLDLDFSQVTHIPGPLLAVLATVARQGTTMHVHNPSVDMAEVIRITKFDRFLMLDEPDESQG